MAERPRHLGAHFDPDRAQAEATQSVGVYAGDLYDERTKGQGMTAVRDREARARTDALRMALDRVDPNRDMSSVFSLADIFTNYILNGRNA